MPAMIKKPLGRLRRSWRGVLCVPIAGDTSLFEAQAGWLKSTKVFDAVLKTLNVRGTVFSGVKLNFPKGNDEDVK